MNRKKTTSENQIPKHGKKIKNQAVKGTADKSENMIDARQRN